MTRTLILILCIISINAEAQSYQLLPDSCTFCSYQYSTGGATHYPSNYHVDPNLDTTVFGNVYTKVLYSGDSFSAYQPFGIRQTGNQLYGVVHDSIQEYLLMDFDAAVGDTITNLYSEGYFYDAIVTAKDSTLIGSSFYHHWVELIGDTVYGIPDYHGWIFRWQERTICNTETPLGGQDPYPYGGVNFNLPWNYQLLGSAYVNVNYCTGDVLFSNSSGFSCEHCELATNSMEELTLEKNPLIKIIDLMGRETEFKPNTTLIYLFSDGTSEKVFKME